MRIDGKHSLVCSSHTLLEAVMLVARYAPARGKFSGAYANQLRKATISFVVCSSVRIERRDLYTAFLENVHLGFFNQSLSTYSDLG